MAVSNGAAMAGGGYAMGQGAAGEEGAGGTFAQMGKRPKPMAGGMFGRSLGAMDAARQAQDQGRGGGGMGSAIGGAFGFGGGGGSRPGGVRPMPYGGTFGQMAGNVIGQGVQMPGGPMKMQKPMPWDMGMQKPMPQEGAGMGMPYRPMPQERGGMWQPMPQGGGEMPGGPGTYQPGQPVPLDRQAPGWGGGGWEEMAAGGGIGGGARFRNQGGFY